MSELATNQITLQQLAFGPECDALATALGFAHKPMKARAIIEEAANIEQLLSGEPRETRFIWQLREKETLLHSEGSRANETKRRALYAIIEHAHDTMTVKLAPSYVWHSSRIISFIAGSTSHRPPEGWKIPE